MMYDMDIDMYFPTVIGSVVNIDLQEKMLPIVEDILQDESKLTYEWGYKNTYTGYEGIEQAPEMNEFIEFIQEIGEQYLNNLGYISPGLNPTIFASQMFQGDKHPRHCHSNATLSGVFYLDCPPGSSDIVFYDPRNFRDVKCLSTIEQNSLNSPNCNYSPQPGLLLLWESWIHHEVLENKSETGRTTLVFNA